MNVSQETVAALLELQKADLAALKASREFEALPQRAKIVEAREKRRSLEEKRAQVEALIGQVESKIAAIDDENARLAAKSAEVQSAIDGAGGDYRNVEARTKELDGIAKRTAVLESDLEAAAAQLEKAEGVRAQIDKAVALVDAEEEKATASFREEGGALQERIGKEKARREALLSALPDDLASLYEKTSARCGGVAVAVLSGTSCGACRTPISHERLIDIRRQAPLSTCPSCHRLLVVV